MLYDNGRISYKCPELIRAKSRIALEVVEKCLLIRVVVRV